jgi:hypothetical protein
MLLLIFHKRNIMMLPIKSFVTFRICGMLLTCTAFKSGDFGILICFCFHKEKKRNF